jgi:hypothetical protein
MLLDLTSCGATLAAKIIGVIGREGAEVCCPGGHHRLLSESIDHALARRDEMDDLFVDSDCWRTDRHSR